MIDLNSILLPTDFSKCSQEAAEYACAFADQFGAELHVLHVIHDWTVEVPEFGMGLTFPGYLEHIPQKLEELEKAAIQELAGFLPAGWQEGKQVVLATKQGSPFVKILEYAKSHQINLIVMGTHGRGALSHALLGSVAEKVVRKADCPVLTVRPHDHQFVKP